MMEPLEVVKVVGVISTVAGASLATWRRAIRPAIRATRKHYRNLEAVPLIEESVKKLREEFSPNGGGSIRDLLDRVEESIVLLQAKQEVALDRQDICLLRADCSGLIIEVSDPLCRLIGKGEREMSGWNWLSLVNEAVRSDVEDEYHSAIKAHRVFDMEFSLMTAFGVLKVRMRMSPVSFGPKSACSGHVGTIVPVFK